jgi:hypothetical protein
MHNPWPLQIRYYPIAAAFIKFERRILKNLFPVIKTQLFCKKEYSFTLIIIEYGFGRHKNF